MKKITNFLFLFICLILIGMMTSCYGADGSGDAYGGGYGGGYADMEGEIAGGYEDSKGDVPGASEEEPGEGSEDVESTITKIPAGQLTACAYSDNEKYLFWQGLLTTNQEGKGAFKDYADKFDFHTANRIKLQFPAKTYVKVELLDQEEKVIATTYSDASGVCYLYPNEVLDSYEVNLTYTDLNDEVITSRQTITGDSNFVLEAKELERKRIELMFVIDTTGSMGDELAYVKSEVEDVINRVAAANPNTEVLLSILCYRDVNDTYVTKYSDFSTDINVSKNFVSLESAGGGGDYEEAVHTALLLANEKQWSDTATKIIIHIADAPAHDYDVDDWNKAALALASKGVRIITVASSGIDKKTEYFFRSQSVITNGHYVYLTDDSGIGGSHLEATVEERPVVEFLNDSLVRLINGYHTGEMAEPVYYRNVMNQNQQ